MKINFTIADNKMVPIVYIDDVWLAIVSLKYTWHTTTDKADSGINLCFIEGYLPGSRILRRFMFDIRNSIVTEICGDGEIWN